jgi:phosphoribosylformylglycinamidine (FGAM) synthase-like enzyme
LFVLEIIGLVLGAVGVYRRCHYAVIAEEAADAAFRDRVGVAIALERRMIEERRQNATEESDEIVVQEKKEEAEIDSAIRTEDRKLQRQHTKAAQDCNFGPTFPIGFKDESSDSISTSE